MSWYGRVMMEDFERRAKLRTKKTAALWELREESRAGERSLLIASGEERVLEWLGSLSVPRDGYRIVMREKGRGE
jgi:hypothetical protein